MKVKTIFSTFTFLFILFLGYGQPEVCNLQKLNDEGTQAYLFDADDVPCITQNSEKEFILIYTFGIWCEPCINNIGDTLKLVWQNDLDFYVLIKDRENNWATKDAISYLMKIQELSKEHYPDFKINILVLKDSDGRPNKKYMKFLTKITPSEFENIDDMSKYILFDTQGKLLAITTYKDKKDIGNWKMIEDKIMPLLD